MPLMVVLIFFGKTSPLAGLITNVIFLMLLGRRDLYEFRSAQLLIHAGSASVSWNPPIVDRIATAPVSASAMITGVFSGRWSWGNTPSRKAGMSAAAGDDLVLTSSSGAGAVSSASASASASSPFFTAFVSPSLSSPGCSSAVSLFRPSSSSSTGEAGPAQRSLPIPSSVLRLASSCIFSMAKSFFVLQVLNRHSITRSPKFTVTACRGSSPAVAGYMMASKHCDSSRRTARRPRVVSTENHPGMDCWVWNLSTVVAQST
mmetsp:Transcript_60/g.204  ORF Transcript_60/g.204 Transcript_60/m.204 type:complete len:260 (-) Transcript_60:1274-2053(-)